MARTRQISTATTAAALLVCVAAWAMLWQAHTRAGSRTIALGRAQVAYWGDAVQLAAGYNYSQNNHDGRWLFVEVALMTTQVHTMPRDAFTLELPNGERRPLASHREWAGDYPAIRRLLQNAQPQRLPLRDLLNAPNTTRVQLFAPPFQGVSMSAFGTDQYAVVLTDLFFDAADGRWPAGTYHLVLSHDGVLARVPIQLR